MARSRDLQAWARKLRDLRISVVDRCNFRCPYCNMPEDQYPRDQEFPSKAERLRFEEIEPGAPVRGPRCPQVATDRRRAVAAARPARTRSGKLAVPGIDDRTDDHRQLARGAGRRRCGDAIRGASRWSLDTIVPGDRSAIFPAVAARSRRGARRDRRRRAGRFPQAEDQCRRDARDQRRRGDRAVEHQAAAPHRALFHRVHGRRHSVTTGATTRSCRAPSCALASQRSGRWSRSSRTTAARSHGVTPSRTGRARFGSISSVTELFYGDCSRARLSADGKPTPPFAGAGTICAAPLRAGASDEEPAGLIRAVWRPRRPLQRDPRGSLGGRARARRDVCDWWMFYDRELTHVDAGGRPAMVDVGAKAATRREAVAEAIVRFLQVIVA